MSGFFLEHATVDGRPVYPEQMRNIFELANSTHGLNDACIAAQPPGKEWQCNLAQHAFAHTKSPTFPLNSALDSWQTGCIFTSALVAGFPNQHTDGNGNCGVAPLHWKACSDGELLYRRSNSGALSTGLLLS